MAKEKSSKGKKEKGSVRKSGNSNSTKKAVTTGSNVSSKHSNGKSNKVLSKTGKSRGGGTKARSVSKSSGRKSTAGTNATATTTTINAAKTVNRKSGNASKKTNEKLKKTGAAKAVKSKPVKPIPSKKEEPAETAEDAAAEQEDTTNQDSTATVAIAEEVAPPPPPPKSTKKAAAKVTTRSAPKSKPKPAKVKSMETENAAAEEAGEQAEDGGGGEEEAENTGSKIAAEGSGESGSSQTSRHQQHQPQQQQHQQQSDTNGSENGESSDDANDGESEQKKPKAAAGAEEPLEFTKPTINQMKKEKKEKPLNYSEKISGREFESLNDEITELNSGVQMLKHSYGSIIKSLVAMQDRRAKKKAAKEAAQRAAEGKATFLTTLSTMDACDLKTRSCLEATDKYDIERFLNPVSREETFNALFDEIDELNKKTEELRNNFYDPRGHFLRDKYDAQTEVKLNRTQFNEFKIWTKKLAAVVDDIARNYNDDLLNMFRLS